MRAWASLAIPAAFVACSVPEIQFVEGSATTNATTSTGSGAGGAATTGTATGGGQGGSTTATTTATTASQGAGGQGGGGGCADADRDGYFDAACGGDDCDDDDEYVSPGQTGWFSTEHPVVGFDYNCSTVEERNPAQLFKGTGTVMCALGDCGNPPESGYSKIAPCGLTFDHFRCEGLTCDMEVAVMGSVPLGCH